VPRKLLRRLVSFTALIAAVAAFRNRKLTQDEARFNR
jgi:hypothetical protein